jgi:hypothetical protein
MSYPARYYQMQDGVMRDVRWAGTTGLCPVCRVRPAGVWPTGVRRITCGADACFLRWLPVRGTIDTTTQEETQP